MLDTHQKDRNEKQEEGGENMFQTTSSTLIVGLLIAGVALLLYGVRLITDAVQRATDARVQRTLTQLARYPLAAFGLGTLAT